MGRVKTDSLRAAAAFAVASACVVVLAVMLLDEPTGASGWWKTAVGAVAVAALAVVVTAPVWRILVAPAPSFPKGAAAGVVAVVLGHAFPVAVIAVIAVASRPSDPMLLAVIVLAVFGLSAVVAVPTGGLFGGMVGYVQQRRRASSDAPKAEPRAAPDLAT